ncbi:hypothetical protein D1007_46477 [Hordeum vulgare]|nr:hypothetical protein D1007_46477 [Hordeum vulgare]
MGPAAVPARVLFRAGPFTPFGERVAHVLVMRYGVVDCVKDNACRLENADFPVDGSIVSFGLHRVNVAVIPDRYPTEVLSCDKPPPADDNNLSCSIDDLCDRVEVLTVTSHGGASGSPTPIRASMDTLRTPIPQVADPAVATQELDSHRL